MSGPEFLVAIVAIGCVTSIIHTWMKQRDKNGGTINNERLQKLEDAFQKHQKNMRKRVQNLESIIADEDDLESDYTQIETSSAVNTLTNDLQQKDKIQS